MTFKEALEAIEILRDEHRPGMGCSLEVEVWGKSPTTGQREAKWSAYISTANLSTASRFFEGATPAEVVDKVRAHLCPQPEPVVTDEDLAAIDSAAEVSP